jgi:hypothetical protein
MAARHSNIGRSFSSASPHHHDVIHRNFHGTSTDAFIDPVVTDYWKAHPDEHYTTYGSLLSQHDAIVDFWKDHGDTHFATEDKFQNPGHRPYNHHDSCFRNFSSIRRTVTAATDKIDDGKTTPVRDYWADHADSHFTDYWTESKGKTHF